jgi:protein-tyrosine phosphatase
MEVLPHFWITYYKENLYFIKEKKIKNIIHLSKKENFIKKINTEEIIIPIDYTEENTYEEQNNIIYQHLFDITDYIHNKIINNEKVLLLGQENKQDIDTIIVAYLIRYAKLNIHDSILFLKTKKENLFSPKCLFYFSLNRFYNQLNKNY